MHRLRSRWRLRQHTALAAAEADIVTLARVLANRTAERDAARREVDELAAALASKVAELATLRAAAEDRDSIAEEVDPANWRRRALRAEATAARLLDELSRFRSGVWLLPSVDDERDEAARHAQVERTGGR